MIFARVFLPFALGFLLSYLLRVINSVIAPSLIVDLGLNASELGLLTSANFFALAAFQLPLGVLLDRYGPRKTESVLLLIAAGGTALFAVATSMPALLAGRAMMGLGTSACLMAAFTAFALWFPRERLPVINSYQMVAGGLGALVGTTPVEFLETAVGWRGVFWVLTGVIVMLAALIYIVVPQRKSAVAGKETLRENMAGIGVVFTRPIFWRIAPACVMNQASFIGIQSLWLGPWFKDVLGFDSGAMADALFLVAATMVGSFFVSAWISQLARRFGIGALFVSVTGMCAFIAVQAMIVLDLVPVTVVTWMVWTFAGSFGVIAYAGLTQRFPAHMAGRVVTGINVMAFFGAFAVQWGVGAIIDLWPPQSGGGFDSGAYNWAFGVVMALHAVTMLWLFVFRRERVGESPS